MMDQQNMEAPNESEPTCPSLNLEVDMLQSQQPKRHNKNHLADPTAELVSSSHTADLQCLQDPIRYHHMEVR